MSRSRSRSNSAPTSNQPRGGSGSSGGGCGTQQPPAIVGTTGDETLTGTAGNDKIYGNGGSDSIFGGAGNDNLFVGSATSAASGVTTMYGDAGNDVLTGGTGTSTLVGSNEVARGLGEVDKLIGGVGADTFVLGDAQGSYYLGGSADYATISNFNTANDVIQLGGTAADYTITYSSGGCGGSSVASISYNNNGVMDLVAQISGAPSGLDLTSSYFAFAGGSDGGGGPK